MIKQYKTAIALILTAGLFCAGYAKAQQALPFDGSRSTWHEGFTRYDFIMDDSTLAITPFRAPAGEGFGIKAPPAGKHRCVLIAPASPAAGNPWSWRGCYWDHRPQAEIALLKRGFYIAYISAGEGMPPGKQWDAWYNFLVANGLSPKPCFVGMSRGGQFEYTWATDHPDKVTCIYADNPAITQEALMKLGSLARSDVPLLHVCGSFDPLFNVATGPAENIYQQFGGRISVMIKEGFGHHPHSLRDPKVIADFMVQSFKEHLAPAPAFAGRHAFGTWLYSDNYTYRYYPSQNAYITARGAFFVPAYRRYLVQIPGVDAFTTIIAPLKPAAGNPWVFRADRVTRDDTLSFALLSKGYYIVTGAVPYNYDGPMLSQWNNIYKYLRGFGFSSKPVMAGSGGAAGEAIAWAIENPDHVKCIYAVNPILQSKAMMKTQPLDTLAPLASRKVPVMFICGADDPSLNSQALVARKRYRQLGGRITVAIIKGQGHYLSPAAPAIALDFIAEPRKKYR